MNKQEKRGKVNQLEGRAKRAAGTVTGNDKLEHAGSRQQTKGEVQDQVGQARRKTGEAVAKVAKTIKD